MDRLNYHHLLYFWVVAKEGSIVAAGKKLRLANPTLSGQIHRLEKSLGQKLFARRGRRLVLTEAGQVAMRYANEIFTLGRDFAETIKGRVRSKPVRLVVGIAETLPAALVRRFLLPAFKFGKNIQIVVRADKPVEELLAEMAQRRLDVVISDAPAGDNVPVRAFNHLLGECGTTFMAAPKLATRLRGKFPGSLHGAPFLHRAQRSAMRKALDEWF